MNEDILNAAIAANVAAALAEDLGDGERRRDLTAQLIPADVAAHARVITRQDAVLAGQDWFAACFRVLDPNVRLLWQAADGEPIRAGQMLCEIRGNARALLSAERPALNFLQTLSGVATATRDYVSAVAGTRAKIYDTRKTLPGLRLALKYAVKCGGGENQRIGLYDGILIKENHIAAAGGIRAALDQAFALAARPAAPLSPDPSPPHPRPFPPGGKGDSTRLSPFGREVGSEGWGGEIPVQIEVENLEQLREALDAGATLILLDNFVTDDLRAAVRLAAGRARLEASGGITLDNVRAIAETGVDRISIGALTKNLRALDLSLRLVG